MWSHSTLMQPSAQGQFTAFHYNENIRILNPNYQAQVLVFLDYSDVRMIQTYAADGPVIHQTKQYSYIQGGSNMTGTYLYVNKSHCAAAVRP